MADSATFTLHLSHLAAPFWEVKALTHTQPRDSLATVTLKATFAPRCFQGELLPQGQ